MVRRLFVIDGARLCVRRFGTRLENALSFNAARCTKCAGVLDHLPEKMRPSVAAQMKAAYRNKSKSIAKKKLLKLIGHSHNNYPDAAACLREGLDETRFEESLAT